MAVKRKPEGMRPAISDDGIHGGRLSKAHQRPNQHWSDGRYAGIALHRGAGGALLRSADERRKGAGWTLLMFAVFGSINVILVSGLIAGILLHDEHQRFLFGELQHRSRNLFAVVQSIVSRTIIESQTLSDAKQAAETRLAALARTLASLEDSGWTGAPLDKIVLEELTSFATQVNCSGCDLLLNTPAAQTFALIIHELATNAVKHGALSRPEGRISICGSIKPGNLFQFAWTEIGGPVVTPPPKKGFGSSILSGMAKRFAQDVEASYRPEGLIYELRIPLGSIQSSQGKSSADQNVAECQQLGHRTRHGAQTLKIALNGLSGELSALLWSNAESA
jgi:two-component sensor histidine kinase